MKGFSIALWAVGFSSLAFATPPKQTPDLIAKGKTIFSQQCAVCHGEKGDAQSPAAQAMNPKPRNLIADQFKAGETVEKIFESITMGLPNTTMTAFAHIPAEDRWALAYFVSSLRAKKGVPARGRKK